MGSRKFLIKYFKRLFNCILDHKINEIVCSRKPHRTKSFDDAVSFALKKCLRCSCPRQKGTRTRMFYRLMIYSLKHLKLRTGWNCRKPRLALIPVASKLDGILNNILELKNPFHFYSLDEELSRKVQIVLQTCRIPRPLPYDLVLSSWRVKSMTKIAEGSYGEVYAFQDTPETKRILKTIAVYGTPRDDPGYSLDIEDVVSDAICTKHLSMLTTPGVFQAPNFPKSYNIDLVKGKAPRSLVEAWLMFQDDPDTEETTHFRPDRYTSDSLFLIMELENCGENVLVQNLTESIQVLSLILQTASALAVAECAFGFEHRDLHLGNWMFKQTTQSHMIYSTDTWRWKVPSFNVQAFIIDFTMSRIEIDGHVFAMDLSNLDSNEVESDASILNLDTIYNMMKDDLHDFNGFYPKTNIWWLSHLTFSMYEKLKDRFYNSGDMLTNSDEQTLSALERLTDNMMTYSNTMDFIIAEVFELQDNPENFNLMYAQI